MQTEQTHFVHRTNYRTREKLVGWFILLAFLALLLQLFVSSQISTLFEEVRDYSIELRQPTGVNKDTKVRVAGIDVGWVEDVSLTDSNTFLIDVRVYDKFHTLIREDSRASVSRLAVVGNSIIEITIGSQQAQPLAAGAKIQTEETFTMEDLIARVQPMLEQAEKSVTKINEMIASFPADAIPDLMYEAQASVNNLRTISETVARGEGSLGELVMKPDASKQVQNSLQASQQLIDEGRKSIAQINESLGSLPLVVAELTTLVEKLSQSASDIPKLVEDTSLLVGDSNELVDGLSETWPLSTVVDPDPDHDEMLPALPAN